MFKPTIAEMYIGSVVNIQDDQPSVVPVLQVEKEK